MTQTPPQQVVKDTGAELIDPVVDHAERLTKVEGNLTHTEERLNRQIVETETQLRQALEASGGDVTSRINSLMDKLGALEEKVNALAVHPVKTGEEGAGAVVAVPGEAVTLVTPPVEDSPSPPEKERRSIRHRRKNRRIKK